MWPDGICRVTDTLYTKTVQFQDINYQLAQNDDKTSIFEGWCDFLNYFDSSIRFQFSFLNLSSSRESFEQRIHIPPQGDAFDDVRSEYADIEDMDIIGLVRAIDATPEELSALLKRLKGKGATTDE